MTECDHQINMIQFLRPLETPSGKWEMICGKGKHYLVSRYFCEKCKKEFRPVYEEVKK